MKKIMFNEQYGMQSAVLARRKTMTRRIVKHPKKFRGHDDIYLEYHRRPGVGFCYDCVVCDADDHELGQLPLPYEVGDVVAIAQCYSKISDRHDDWLYNRCAEKGINADNLLYEAGWFNKMFVRSDLMPHHVRITDLYFQNLHEISDDDCLKEGIFLDETAPKCYQPYYTFEGSFEKVCPCGYETPRLAFQNLIYKILGTNTWHDNPWVVAYTFELID